MMGVRFKVVLFWNDGTLGRDAELNSPAVKFFLLTLGRDVSWLGFESKMLSGF